MSIVPGSICCAFWFVAFLCFRVCSSQWSGVLVLGGGLAALLVLVQMHLNGRDSFFIDPKNMDFTGEMEVRGFK